MIIAESSVLAIHRSLDPLNAQSSRSYRLTELSPSYLTTDIALLYTHRSLDLIFSQNPLILHTHRTLDPLNSQSSRSHILTELSPPYLTTGSSIPYTHRALDPIYSQTSLILYNHRILDPGYSQSSRSYIDTELSPPDLKTHISALDTHRALGPIHSQKSLILYNHRIPDPGYSQSSRIYILTEFSPSQSTTEISFICTQIARPHIFMELLDPR